MLALLVRGVFLIGILTWYSTSVWKMIDGYFRDQVRSYLEEEYRKNPRMKSDVHGDSVDNVDPVLATPRPEATVAPREIPQVTETEARTVEAADNDTTSVVGETNEELLVTGGTSENEDAGGSTDKNAFLGTVAESGLESRKSSEENVENSRETINQEDDRDLERRGNDHCHRSVSQESKSSRKRIKYERRPTAVPRDISRENQLPRRRNVRTIVLTERDFKSVTKNHVSDDEFWEFEEDACEKEPLEGIPVSQLPFKPRADIGDLDRVTADEYCPLTLEDEASCGQTFTWF
ncbi:hypothetical protein WH47_09066 [Habropoda laboriosa]|uniref:Uncharacterized protein n=1 Tax=Habropoda laboriosa TaxID=597456 RepID=A0A0L7QLX0_9HYME|nr:PREDICTED: uncharacterized protein LOC108577579 [Habropoda laboriosa]KOC59544.1 hypothetical protein WH47_09066 [Habropoda laboriosa]